MLEDKLTQRQKRVFDFICRQLDEQGICPSIREIAQEMGFSSPNGVMCHLRALEKKGLIEREDKISRGIALTEQADAERYGLPLVGRVAAGALMQAYEQEEHVDMSGMWKNRNHFMLEVEGDSMIDAHIQSGDLVVIRRARTASAGDIVVAQTDDGEATLKYWFPEKNRIRLQPANSKMKPIYSRDAKVIGVLAGVVRMV